LGVDLDMGEDKLRADLLCCPPHCQEKKTYIVGNKVFFALLGAKSLAIIIPILVRDLLVRGSEKGWFRALVEHLSPPLTGGDKGEGE